MYQILSSFVTITYWVSFSSSAFTVPGLVLLYATASTSFVTITMITG